MNPYRLAQIVYETEISNTRSLDEDVLLWASSEEGIIHKTPEFFLLAAVCGGIDENAQDSRLHVHLMTGDVKAAISHLLSEAPEHYPNVSHVSWERFGRLKVFRVARVLRLFKLADTRPKSYCQP